MKAIQESANRRREAGFSLLEVLIAIMILTVGILALVPMLAFSIKANSLGKDYAFANFLAQQRLDQIYAWPVYQDVVLTNPTQYPGVTANNAKYFGTETVYDDRGRAFTRVSEVVRNGYLGSANNVIWSSTSTNTNEGAISNPTDPNNPQNNNWQPISGASLNTGASVGEWDTTNGGYRGEDFEMVRVRVSWYDGLGQGVGGTGNAVQGATGAGVHEIERHMFIAKY